MPRIQSGQSPDKAAYTFPINVECEVSITASELRAMLDNILNTGHHPELRDMVVAAVKGAQTAGRLDRW